MGRGRVCVGGLVLPAITVFNLFQVCFRSIHPVIHRVRQHKLIGLGHLVTLNEFHIPLPLTSITHSPERMDGLHNPSDTLKLL